MYDYNKLFLHFLQYKHYLGYKYRTDEIVLKEGAVCYETGNILEPNISKISPLYSFLIWSKIKSLTWGILSWILDTSFITIAILKLL